jgi:hypothetical protein
MCSLLSNRSTCHSIFENYQGRKRNIVVVCAMKGHNMGKEVENP